MAYPPKTIVVATDLSEASESALRAAAHHAAADGASVHMVHVFDPAPFRAPPSLSGPSSLLDQAAQQLQAAHEANLADQAKTFLPDTQLEAVALRHVSAGEAIADYAEKVGADLVIVGSHGRTGLRRMLLGSVAERVVRLAPCAVLVVR